MAMMDKSTALAGLMGGEEPGEGPAPTTYDADLKTALADLASALGVTVKSPSRGVEALKTIHDLCARGEQDEGE